MARLSILNLSTSSKNDVSRHFSKPLSPMLAALMLVIASQAHAVEINVAQQQAMGIQTQAALQVASVPSEKFLAEVMTPLDKIRHVTAPADVRVAVLHRVHGPVRKGEVIALLESAEISRLQGDYLSAAKLLVGVEKTWKRLQKLSKSGAASIDLMEQSQAQVNEYKAQMARAIQSLKVLNYSEERIKKLQSEQTIQPPLLEIKSDQDALLHDLVVSEGQVVEAYQPMFMLAAIDPITVHVSVPVALARQLEEGQTAQIFSGEQILSASVRHIEKVVDVMTQTVDVHIHMPNPESPQQLLPGEKVQVQFAMGAQQAVYQVPLRSLTQVDGEQSIFVKNGAQIEPVAVKVQATRGDQLYFSAVDFNAQQAVVNHGTTAIKLAMSAGEEE